jgi:LPXTG-site transpeptidase (sortase) family protein
VSTIELLRQQTTSPSRVQVPDLGIDMPVEAHGLEANGDMSLPVSPFVAGWYEYGSAPDSRTGATVLAAHVDSLPEGVGPFRSLRDASEGLAVVVTDANNVVHEYRIVSVEKINKSEVPLDRVFSATGDPHLVMVTCGGEYDWGIGRYNDNYIVTAEKVS